MEQSDMMRKQILIWTAPWREEGFEEGLKQGMEQALARRRTLIVRMVTRKFDATIAERLPPLLNRIGEPKNLIQIVDWIMDCEQPEELLARTETLVNNSRSLFQNRANRGSGSS